MSDVGLTARRVVVTGSVQGVGYRWAAAAEAERLGVVGIIRNRFDGAVEAEIEGTADAVDAMLDWLAHGPSSARVSSTDATPIEAPGRTEFRITG